MKTNTCKIQLHIISRCNEEDKEEKDHDQDIDGKKTTQYKENEQPSKLKMKVGSTNEME